jgi:methyl-accepting chemotaxis protein
MQFFGSIRSRVLFGTLALALIPLLIAAGVIGYLSYQSARDTIVANSSKQLESIRVVQNARVNSYFESLKRTMLIAANDPSVHNTFKAMRDSFPTVVSATAVPIESQREAVKSYFTSDFSDEFRRRNAGKPIDISGVVDALTDQTIALQYLYIAKNENPLGSKNSLISSNLDVSGYAKPHSELQLWVKELVNQFKIYDFFLVDMDGNVIYTYFKEADYATDLVNGPYAGTNLGDAFLAARDGDDLAQVHLQDYREYLPSYNAPAAFLSAPVVENGQRIGVLIFQAPIDEVNAVMTFNSDWANSGLGASGQSFLMGPDKTTRSISRPIVQNAKSYVADLTRLKFNADRIKQTEVSGTDVASLELDSPGINEAIAGKVGVANYVNHLGNPVLGAYSPIEVLGLSWGNVVEVNQDEAFAPLNSLLTRIGTAALATAVLLGLIGLFFASRLSNSINRPISKLQATVQEVTAGNLEARAKMQGTDELAQLGGAFDNLLDEKVSTLAQAAVENEMLNNSVIEIMKSLGQIAQNDLTIKAPVTGDITGAISDAINLVTSETSDALRQVLSISTNVARASTQVRQRAAEVTSAAEKNGVEVNSASRELEGAATALNLIAQQAQQANASAERAISATSQALGIVSETVRGVSLSRDQIRETEKRLKRLGERSQEITTVVNIINQIAERTSVLALNAGMQAAAAGEAGRGFALVADEVKRLAESARDATRQIGTLVNGIQADSGDTIRTMNETITQVVEISKLAERAGEQMEKTLSATDGLVGSVREIANTTADQAKASSMLLQRAQTIEATNRDTLTQLSSQRDETARLMQYSKALIDTVRVFKLPESDSSNS